MSEKQPIPNVLVLAAGRGTRIESVTEKKGVGFPKGLLEINGVAIIENLLDQLEKILDSDLPIISKVALIANKDSFPYYKKYISEFHPRFEVHSNNIGKEDKRLGAIGDLVFLIKKLGWEKNSLLVLPSDTLTNVSLREVIETFRKGKKNINVVHDIKDIDKIRNQLGAVEIGQGNTIVGFEEKPINPKSSITSVPIYLYTPEALEKIIEFEKQARGENKTELLDSPGAILPWLIQQVEIQAFFTEEYSDVGRAEVLTRLRNKS